jgi:DNA-binding CsgD family transcriptional regulator
MKASLLPSPIGAWKFMAPDRAPNTLLQGHYQGFFRYRLQGERWVPSGKLSGFDESSRVFEEDAYGTLWMTHGYKGVYRLQYAPAYDSLLAVDFYGQEQGLPSNLLINVFKIAGRLVFAASSGIYRFDAPYGRFVPDETLSPYFSPGEHISEMAEDLAGNVYFLGSGGMGVLRRKQVAGYVREGARFARIQSLVSDDLENIWPIDAHNVLIGAKDGFIHYNPLHAALASDSFRVLLREAVGIAQGDTVWFHGNSVVDGQVSAEQGKNLPRFAYEHNGFRFRYAAQVHAGQEGISYRYWLEGFEEGWSDWTPKTEKEYTNLPEGVYCLKVVARNIYGTESQEMRYRFRILPPWYRTAWAYAGYGLLAASAFGLALVSLDRKYRRERRLLQLRQERELNRKEHEIQAMAAESERAIAVLAKEKLEAEVQYKTQELASATMNLLHKNEFLSRMRAQLQALKNKSSKTLAKDIDRLIKDIERDMQADDSWGHFEHQFTQVHGDFSQRLQRAFPELTPQELKLSAYLRMNMSTKEIAGLLSISVRGVEIARYRLRKKLQLERNDNLTNFLLNF